MFSKKYFIKGLDWAKLGAFAVLGLFLPVFLNWNHAGVMKILIRYLLF